MARKKISKKVNDAVRRYVHLLADDHLPIEQAFLFGSTVKGTARPDSDIDVAIISNNLSHSFASTKYLLKKAHELGFTDIIIEPHGFHPTEFTDASPLAYEIKRTGIRIE
ncbi:MAG: nucleotidyltransferase domain-containing protein [Patescibacteria group bacterium]